MSEQRRPGKYPDELRERAVRMVYEAERDCGSQWEAISSVAEKLGPTPETVRKWAARIFVDRYYDNVLGASESAEFTRADMMRVLYEIAGSPSVSSPEPASTTWEGTSTFNGEPLYVVCGSGPAEFTWNLEELPDDRYITHLAMLFWVSPSDEYLDVDVEVTGPNGATTTLYGFHGHQSSFSFSEGPYGQIDAGEATFSVMPEAKESGEPAVWGLSGLLVYSHQLIHITSKLQQHWASSVNCDRPSG